MNTFTFEIQYEGSNLKHLRYVTSNHLQGGIRKLYQQEAKKFELKRIVQLW